MTGCDYRAFLDEDDDRALLTAEAVLTEMHRRRK
jgi:hypothetical protein